MYVCTYAVLVYALAKAVPVLAPELETQLITQLEELLDQRLTLPLQDVLRVLAVVVHGPVADVDGREDFLEEGLVFELQLVELVLNLEHGGDGLEVGHIVSLC